ncbi:MAG: tRNA 2-thiocytidine biosynthesis protein TtcA [Treponema sp.]|jgi:tRNA(Ile)-lysidine synthase TilS/MesJ|nr:MAG: tRNA 2-thiocytidine biosynthesis protein TtcA [Treponema sp.]HPX47065.1 tRNA 2-thiocytidine biosynthesis TtcA family protein [Treponemataceae bacterium]
MANPRLFRVIDHGIAEYSMIEPGDRILIGASGGKDSTALVEYFGSRLLRLARHGGPSFQAAAVHVATEIGSPLAPELAERFSAWNVPLHTLTVSVLGRLKPGRTMNCWWCSTQRRTELNEFALREGFNKIALGHHLDDILETLLMNALVKGELSTMPPRLTYEKYPVTLIRPLCFADIPMIVRHATEAGYISTTCTCTYQQNSGRRSARSKLEALTGGNYNEKLKLFTALRNIKTDYLP